jgi:hypothetical protein
LAVGLAFVFFWVVICCLLSFRLLPYQTPFLFFFFLVSSPLPLWSELCSFVCVCVYKEFVVVAVTVLFLGRIWVLASKVHTSISLGLRVTKTIHIQLSTGGFGQVHIISPSFWCFCWTGFCKGSELFTETDLFHIGFESCVDTHALARPPARKEGRLLDCLG